MKLHRSIFSQIFPYIAGQESASAQGSPASQPNDMFARTGESGDKPITQPQRPPQMPFKQQPMVATESLVTPNAEESVTIDEGNLPVTEQGQAMGEYPLQQTQLQRLEGNPNRDPQLVNRMAELRRGPMNEMEMFAGSGGAATRAPMPMGTPGTMAPGGGSPDRKAYDKEQKKFKQTFEGRYPEYKDKYLNPANDQESAANATARMEYERDNPRNKDKGWKGLLRELAENFAYGMGKTPAGADWKQALLLGGVGAGAGFVNKSWNERRAAEAALPGLIDAEQRAGQMVNQKFARDDKTRDNLRQDANLIRQREKDLRDAKIRRDTLDWKKEDRDRYYELEQIKQDAREAKDEKTFQLASERQRELERHNKVTEGQAAKNETGRMARAGMTQANQTARAQINSADKARGVLASIDKMIVAGTVDAETAEAKKAEFLRTLTPEVRQQLGMK